MGGWAGEGDEKFASDLVGQVVTYSGGCVSAGRDGIGPEKVAAFAQELCGEEAAIVGVAGGRPWIDGDVASDPGLYPDLKDCIGLGGIVDDLDGVAVLQVVDDQLAVGGRV